MLPIPEGFHIRNQAYGVSGDGSTALLFGLGLASLGLGRRVS